MSNFSKLQGKISVLSTDDNEASHLCDLLANASSEDLASVYLEFRENLFFLGEHAKGSGVLGKLCSRISDLKLEDGNLLLFDDHIADFERLKRTLLHSIGSQSLFSIVHVCDKVEVFMLLLTRTVLVDIMKESMDVEPLFNFLFRNLTVQQLEPLIKILSVNINKISKESRGLPNFDAMIKLASFDVHISLINMIRPFVLELACDKKGNIAIQSMIILQNGAADFLIDALANNIRSLSLHPYGSFVVQRCLQLGTKRNVLFIIYELSSPGLFSLVYERFGNCLSICSEKAISFECCAVQRTHFRGIEKEKCVGGSLLC